LTPGIGYILKNVYSQKTLGVLKEEKDELISKLNA
jgi:hypothetical protein